MFAVLKRASSRTGLALVAAGFFVLPCAGASPLIRTSGNVQSLAEIRYERVIPQKWDTSCGAAALATLLTFDLQDPVSERAVASDMVRRTGALRVRTRGGFSLLNMQQFAEARGYQADGYGELATEDLPALLPAIVPVQFNGYDHFVVVRKIAGGKVFFADPAYGNRVLDVDSFHKAWHLKIAFVVNPKK